MHGTPRLPAAPAFPARPAASPGNHDLLAMVEELVDHARAHDLALADEVLTDILATLHGWPVRELDRLR